MKIGEKISPILVEVENALWEFEADHGFKPGYTNDGFRAGVKIFMSVLMDRIWELQEEECVEQDTREAMAMQAGKDVRKLINVYTGIDTHKMYNEKAD